MANAKFYPADLQRATVTATYENPSFPVSNLLDYVESNVWKSSSANNQQVAFDMGDAIPVNYCMVDYADADGDIFIDGADDSGFSSGVVNAFQGTILDMGVPIEFQGGTYTKRYWRIRFENNNGIIPQAGNIFFGVFFDPGKPYEPGGAVGNKRYETNEIIALSGRIRTSQEYGARKIWNLAYTKGNALTDAKATAFATFFETVKGRLRPFYFVDRDSALYYVFLDTDINPVKHYGLSRNDIENLPIKSATAL